MLACALGAQDAAGSPQAQAPDRVPPLVARHCSKCHSGPDAEEGFEIAPLFAAQPDANTQARIATALQRVRSRTMPPPDAASQPTDGERLELAAALAALTPVPKEARIATVRRLSRAEYGRTVQDLLGVPFAAADMLPEDARAYGFDNIGDVAGVTPLLFERYVEAASALATAVLDDAAATARVFAPGRALAETLPPFLLRAFRRPPASIEVEERLQLARELAEQGRPETEIQHAVLRSVLTSPSFLFRAELGADADAARLSSFELAVRTSYFLAGTMPDAELFARAQDGTLAKPEVLRAQARRLIAGNGGRALADRFAAQWLRFADVLTATADFRRYPQIWNGSLRPSFYEEAARLFAEIAREDGSVLWLIDCDHSWINATLAKHYGLPEVKGGDYVRTPLTDRRRGGLLGMGAILMVSSHSLRTSPVLRGRWILDQLLDASTPPPPPGAGTLPADDKQPDELTLRARLERHRAQKACAACHAQIDPLGFALENWDVLGQWRTEIHGKPIDARGVLPDGTVVDGPVALKDALLLRKTDFVRALATKLLVFAIGRPMTALDEPEIARIVAACAGGDYRFGPLLDALLTSPLFLLRDPGGKS